MWPTLNFAKFAGRRLRCSFCRRDANAVERLVAGASAYICDSCVTQCVAILQERGGFGLPESDAHPNPVR
jgi:ATP-dependent Clp protease ATP-binding subunit ClpX